MSPRIPMKIRHVRVSDPDWEAAQKKADERGDNLSEKIREFIRAYGKGEKVMLTPEQFGAVGDGVTDDTASFQAAINAASREADRRKWRDGQQGEGAK